MAGVDTVVIDDSKDYSIGQSIAVSPSNNTTITDKNGKLVEFSPGVSITGIIMDKK
jgi:hypothetical protein